MHVFRLQPTSSYRSLARAAVQELSGKASHSSPSGSPQASGIASASPSSSPSWSGSPSSSGSSGGGVGGCTEICIGDCAEVSLSLDCIDCPGFAAGDWNILDPEGYQIANQTTPNGWSGTLTSPVPASAIVCVPEGTTPGTYIIYICTTVSTSSGTSGSSSSAGSGVVCYSAVICVIDCSSSSGDGGGSGTSAESGTSGGSGGSGGSGASVGSGGSVSGTPSSSSGWMSYLNCDGFTYFPFAQQAADRLLLPFWGPQVLHPGLTLPSQAGAIFWKVYAPAYIPTTVNMGPLVRAAWPIRLQEVGLGVVQLEREDGTCVDYQWHSDTSSTSLQHRVYSTIWC